MTVVTGILNLRWMRCGTSWCSHRDIGAGIQTLSELGATVDGDIGVQNPVEAVGHCLGAQTYDEIIVSTLPAPSRCIASIRADSYVVEDSWMSVPAPRVTARSLAAGTTGTTNVKVQGPWAIRSRATSVSRSPPSVWLATTRI